MLNDNAVFDLLQRYCMRINDTCSTDKCVIISPHCLDGKKFLIVLKF